MSKRKKTPRTARGRINAPRAGSGPTRGAANKANSGRGIWLYGSHAVMAALQNPNRRRHRLVGTSQAIDGLIAALDKGESTSPQAEIVDRAEIDAVCGPDSVHQGLALLVDPLEDLAIEDIIAGADETDTLIVLDQATDPRNIGAVMRSARAFGCRAIIVQDRNAPVETGAMAKAASGALEHVAMVRVTNLARALWALKDGGYWCIGLAGDGDTEIGNVAANARQAIVLGAEGSGLRRLTRETCDQLVRIPIVSDSESLNLSNAAAVALYALTSKR